MKKTNVLWLIDHVCYDGSLHGGGRLFWNMLPRLESDRLHMVAAMLRADDEIRELFSDSPFPVRILNKSKFDPTTLFTILNIIKQESIDVLHLHCYAASTFGRLAAKIAGKPAIIHDYDTEVYFPYPSYLWLADRLLAPTTAGGMAASPMCRRFMERHRALDSSRIKTMFHAVPKSKFELASSAAVQNLSEELKLPNNAQVVATVTKLGPQRGNELLLHAFAKVVQKVSSAVLVLMYQVTYFHRLPSKKYVEVPDVDKQRLVTELESLAQELGIRENVRLVPSVDKADELVTRADVVTAPFASERFSSVALLEALAKGKPLVATNIGEQQEIIRDGENGFLVSMDSPSEMASRIVELLTDKELCRRIGENARVTAENYSIEANIEALTGWYESLAVPAS